MFGKHPSYPSSGYFPTGYIRFRAPDAESCDTWVETFQDSAASEPIGYHKGVVQAFLGQTQTLDFPMTLRGNPFGLDTLLKWLYRSQRGIWEEVPLILEDLIHLQSLPFPPDLQVELDILEFELLLDVSALVPAPHGRLAAYIYFIKVGVEALTRVLSDPSYSVDMSTVYRAFQDMAPVSYSKWILPAVYHHEIVFAIQAQLDATMQMLEDLRSRAVDESHVHRIAVVKERIEALHEAWWKEEELLHLERERAAAQLFDFPVVAEVPEPPTLSLPAPSSVASFFRPTIVSQTPVSLSGRSMLMMSINARVDLQPWSIDEIRQVDMARGAVFQLSPLSQPVLSHSLMDVLPDDVVGHILTNLDMSEILQMRLVCKGYDYIVRQSLKHFRVPCHRSPHHLSQFLALFPNITSLHLCAKGSTFSDETVLSLLSRTPRLEILQLEHLPSVSADVYSQLCTLCPELRVLKLVACAQLTAAIIATFKHLRDLDIREWYNRSVSRAFGFGSGSLTDDRHALSVAESLSLLGNNPELSCLALPAHNLPNLFTAFARLGKPVQLASLSVVDTLQSIEFPSVIVPVPTVRTFEWTEAHSEEPEWPKVLSQWFPGVKVLKLVGRTMPARFVEFAANSPCLEKLEIISETLDDSAVSALSLLPSLRSLCIRGSQNISDQSLCALMANKTPLVCLSIGSVNLSETYYQSRFDVREFDWQLSVPQYVAPFALPKCDAPAQFTVPHLPYQASASGEIQRTFPQFGFTNPLSPSYVSSADTPPVSVPTLAEHDKPQVLTEEPPAPLAAVTSQTAALAIGEGNAVVEKPAITFGFSASPVSFERFSHPGDSHKGFGCRITSYGIKQFAQRYPGLTSLELCGCPLVEVPALTAVVTACPALEKLTVRECKAIPESPVIQQWVSERADGKEVGPFPEKEILESPNTFKSTSGTFGFSAFGGFGSGTTTATGGFGGFGSGTTTATGGFGGFGSGTTTATGGFGGFGSGTTTTTGGFGGFGSGTTTATGGFGGYGSGPSFGPSTGFGGSSFNQSIPPATTPSTVSTSPPQPSTVPGSSQSF